MIIIKIGGGSTINVKGIISDLSQINEKFIIVHGANHLRDELAKKMNMPKKTLTSVKGFSSTYSDKDEIDMKMIAYAGLKNKRIVELCQQNGINAIGLSGLDGALIKGKRNRGIKVKEGSKIKIIRDFSGKPFEINTKLLNLLMENNYVPVLCIPIIDKDNFAINSENDDIVRVLKNSMNADTVIQLIEAPGYLENKNDPTTLVKSITQIELESKVNQVEGRMKRKMLSLKKLFEQGPCKVIISDGRVEHPIKNALNEIGTVIT
jgi:[amino group carrier protein]-L-2-aminoadipate 6-kinase